MFMFAAVFSAMVGVVFTSVLNTGGLFSAAMTVNGKSDLVRA